MEQIAKEKITKQPSAKKRASEATEAKITRITAKDK
jgi:hypothetical protein